MYDFINLLALIDPSLKALSGAPLVIFLLVVLGTLIFILVYLIRSVRIYRQLTGVISGIRELQREPGPFERGAVGRLFATEPLKHLWDEYNDTLHEVQKAAAGEVQLKETRATMPAEVFFTREVLVDNRLFDDFAKHLPGLLTGLGIIGTFAGLLEGLQSFNPTTSASAVAGLRPLLAGVSHAFIASAAAIGCAMVVVALTKTLLTYFYNLVEQLTHGIDSLYATGAGEEYLSRLVRASEQSEAHAAQLKEALVEDLTQLMTNLVDRQIAAHQQVTQSLGDHIGTSIATAMAEPMRKIGDAIETTARGNGDQVTSMLESLLTAFMGKLEDTFGGQIRGINEQMERSMAAMTAVQQSLQSLLQDVKTANEQATSQMSGKLEEAMQRASDNQQLLTNQMREFVEEFRKLVREEQAKSQRTMDEAVTKVLTDVATSMAGLEAMRQSAADAENGRNQALAQKTTELVGGLSSQVDSLLQQVADQVSKTQQNIDAISQVSLRAIDSMGSGARSMEAAAAKFETAGQSVNGVLDRSTQLSQQMTATAGTLQTAAGAVQRGFEQYDSTRKTVETHVTSLTALIDSAKREAGLSKDLIKAIQDGVTALRDAEAGSRAHLADVNAALTKAFEEFGTQLVSQVKKTIAETDRHLTSGTGHLNGVVQELANAVHRMKKT
jgi:hypothetical protein